MSVTSVELKSENKFFRVTIQIEYINDKGKTQKRKENYLVEAYDPKNAQDSFSEYMKDIVMDYKIISIQETNIISVIS